MKSLNSNPFQMDIAAFMML